MDLLTGFTDQPRQESSFTDEDGVRVVLVLEYYPNQKGWFGTITRGEFEVRGLRLVPSPNWVRIWRNVLPFGLLVNTKGNREVLNQSDLVDGTCSIYLLDSDDVAEVESIVYPAARVLDIVPDPVS